MAEGPAGTEGGSAFTLAARVLLALVSLTALANVLTLSALVCVAGSPRASAQDASVAPKDVGFRKVASNFSILVLDCKLREDMMKMTSRVACASMCNVTPDCSLYCMKGKVCTLFSARVTLKWAGHPKATKGTTFDLCYSSWAFRDVSHLVTADAATYRTWPISRAFDGFACRVQAAHCSVVYARSPLAIELPRPAALSLVRAQVSSAAVVPEVFFGNSSVYSENPAIPATADAAFSTINARPPSGAVGTFLFFRTSRTEFRVCEVAMTTQ